MRTGNRAAQRYAAALLELAKEAKATTQVAEDARLIVETVVQNPGLKALLKSPVIQTENKKKVLEEVFSKAAKPTQNLFAVLAANSRFELLSLIMQSYNELLDAENGFVNAEVITAVPLTDALRTKILVKVKSISGKEGKLTEKVEPAIIGGFILRVGDLEYNASILNQFETLQTQLVN